MIFEVPNTLAELIGKKGLEEYAEIMKRLEKVVSKKSLESIRYEIRPDTFGISIVFIANEKGLYFMEKGKRANTKLPVKKVGDEWELLPDLPDWKELVGFEGSDYILAKTIAMNPRDPIPISEMVAESLRKELKKLLIDNLKIQAANNLKKELKRIHG